MDDLNVVETEFTSWLMDGKKRKRRFVWTATLTSSAKEVFQRLLSDGVTPDAVLCTDGSRVDTGTTTTIPGYGEGIKLADLAAAFNKDIPAGERRGRDVTVNAVRGFLARGGAISSGEQNELAWARKKYRNGSGAAAPSQALRGTESESVMDAHDNSKPVLLAPPEEAVPRHQPQLKVKLMLDAFSALLRDSRLPDAMEEAGENTDVVILNSQFRGLSRPDLLRHFDSVLPHDVPVCKKDVASFLRSHAQINAGQRHYVLWNKKKRQFDGRSALPSPLRRWSCCAAAGSCAMSGRNFFGLQCCPAASLVATLLPVEKSTQPMEGDCKVPFAGGVTATEGNHAEHHNGDPSGVPQQQQQQQQRRLSVRHTEVSLEECKSQPLWLTCDGGETYKRCTLGNINQFHRHVFFTFADTDASTGARTSTSSGGSYSYGVQVTFLDCIAGGTVGAWPPPTPEDLSSGEGAGPAPPLFVGRIACSGSAEASSGAASSNTAAAPKSKVLPQGWPGVFTGTKGVRCEVLASFAVEQCGRRCIAEAPGGDMSAKSVQDLLSYALEKTPVGDFEGIVLPPQADDSAPSPPSGVDEELFSMMYYLLHGGSKLNVVATLRSIADVHACAALAAELASAETGLLRSYISAVAYIVQHFVWGSEPVGERILGLHASMSEPAKGVLRESVAAAAAAEQEGNFESYREATRRAGGACDFLGVVGKVLSTMLPWVQSYNKLGSETRYARFGMWVGPAKLPALIERLRSFRYQEAIALLAFQTAKVMASGGIAAATTAESQGALRTFSRRHAAISRDAGTTRLSRTSLSEFDAVLESAFDVGISAGMVLVSPSGWVASSMYFEMHYVRTLVVCTSGECATDAASYEALMQSKEEHEGDFKALNLVNAAALRRLVNALSSGRCGAAVRKRLECSTGAVDYAAVGLLICEAAPIVSAGNNWRAGGKDRNAHNSFIKGLFGGRRASEFVGEFERTLSAPQLHYNEMKRRVYELQRGSRDMRVRHMKSFTGTKMLTDKTWARESGALSGWVAFDRDFARAWQLHHTMGVSAAACAKK